jgi:hypothetical protein
MVRVVQVVFIASFVGWWMAVWSQNKIDPLHTIIDYAVLFEEAMRPEFGINHFF